MRQATYIARLILRMEDCLCRLGAINKEDDCYDDDATQKHLEEMAILIHDSMSTCSRNYHSVQHVFDVSRNLEDPVAILAALFHDCIYIQIDGGLTEKQKPLLEGTLFNDQGEMKAQTMTNFKSDPLLSMVEHIFGYKEGQIVTQGVSEFLSAVVCVRELENLLPRAVLAELACCIEATIPFRPDNAATGESYMDKLFQNMLHANEKFQLGMTEERTVQAVKRAVSLSNEDVGNFGSEDRWWFLDNTWSLLPEGNKGLRNGHLYTVVEFQCGMFKMHKFFRFIKADVIFQHFRGFPDAEHLALLRRNAIRNLQIGYTYVDCKLLSISVLAAFAVLTGGDAPISLFMGDLPSRHRISERLEDALPQPQGVQQQLDSEVYDLLANGRRTETSFDVKQSPLAAYLYASLGDARLMKIIEKIVLYPMTKESAIMLLHELPRQSVEVIGNKMAAVANSRSKKIREVLKKLNS